MENSTFAFRLDLLRDEIARIQTRIGHYDDLVFRVKGWAVTLWLATIGYSVSKEQPALVLTAIPVVLAFWFIETQYKSYQHRFISRMRLLEKRINSFDSSDYLMAAFTRQSFGEFPIYDPTGWQTSERDEEFRAHWQAETAFARCFWRKHVRALYIYLIVLAVAVFAFAHSAWWNPF